MQIVVNDDPLGGGLVVPIGGSRTGLVVVTIVVASLSPAATGLTSPKSTTFATSGMPPRSHRMMFAGSMSRWIRPASCASMNAPLTCSRI